MEEGARGLWLFSLEKLVSLGASLVSNAKPVLLDNSVLVLPSHAPLVCWLFREHCL